MPKIHVIYDPFDKIRSHPELEEIAKCKIAMLSISDNLSNNEIEEIVEQLGTLLLEQVRIDDKDSNSR